MPSDSYLPELKAVLSQLENDPTDALVDRADELFQAALRLSEADWTLRNAHTHFLLKHRGGEAALSFWLELITRTSGLEALHRGVELFVYFKSPKLALALIERSAKNMSGHEALLCWHAELLVGVGQSWAGYLRAQDVLSLNPDNTAALSLAAEAAFVVGRYHEIQQSHLNQLRAYPDGKRIARAALCFTELPEYDGPQLNRLIHQLIDRLTLNDTKLDFSNRDWGPERPLRLLVLTREAFGSELGQYQCFPSMRSLHQHPGIVLKVFDSFGDKALFRDQWEKADIDFDDVSDLEEEQLIERIKLFEPDVILDWTGHTSYPMGMVLRHRLAPVQMTLYFSALGVEELDAAIYSPPTATASSATDSPLSVKTLDDLPVFAPYVPLSKDISLALSPADRSGVVTFGCFNDLSKINREVLSAWSNILSKVPDSRLVVKARGLEEEAYQPVFKERLVEVGIDPARVELFGRLPEPLYGKIHDMVDILLDTFPFNGATTSLRAVWHGVPIVSKVGVLPYARMGAEVLQQAGIGDYAVNSVPDYVETAVSLAKTPSQLTPLRNKIFETIRQSDFVKPDAYAQAMETAMRRLWVEAIERYKH